MQCVICGEGIVEGLMVWLNDAPAHAPLCPEEIRAAAPMSVGAESRLQAAGCEMTHRNGDVNGLAGGDDCTRKPSDEAPARTNEFTTLSTTQSTNNSETSGL